MQPKTAKNLLRGALMVVSVVVYGTMHKIEKNLGERIDEKYSEPSDDSIKVN